MALPHSFFFFSFTSACTDWMVLLLLTLLKTSPQQIPVQSPEHQSAPSAPACHLQARDTEQTHRVYLSLSSLRDRWGGEVKNILLAGYSPMSEGNELRKSGILFFFFLMGVLISAACCFVCATFLTKQSRCEGSLCWSAIKLWSLKLMFCLFKLSE